MPKYGVSTKSQIELLDENHFNSVEDSWKKVEKSSRFCHQMAAKNKIEFCTANQRPAFFNWYKPSWRLVPILYAGWVGVWSGTNEDTYMSLF